MARASSFIRFFLFFGAAALALQGCSSGKESLPHRPVPTQEGAEYKYPEDETAEAFTPEKTEERALKQASREKPVLYEVMSGHEGLRVDESLSSVHVDLPGALANTAWPQRGGDASNTVGNLKAGMWKTRDSANIGKGRAWKSVLATAPVVANRTVYVMDAEGHVSAHEAGSIGKLRWVSSVPNPGKGKEILGGGLAVAGERVFVSTGQGNVFSLSGKDGSQLWTRDLGVPVRSAPKLANNLVYISTIDDQLFALNALTGQIVWQHRGLGERVGFLTAISPAINDNLVVVAYGSGEIYGLAADTGQEIWNDSLAQIQKTIATSAFTGFSGDPVMGGGIVYTASTGGVTAATHLISGNRLWDRDVSGGSTPWLAGNFLFQLTNDARLVALHADSGSAKWIASLPHYADEEYKLDPYTWFGPLVANGKLLVFGGHGEYRAFSPEDGSLLRQEKISKGISALPVIAGGILYYVTKDAKLHALYE